MAAAAYGASDAGLKAKLLDGGAEPANGGGGSAPHVHSQEESAAYLALRRAGLLTTQHRRSGIEGLDILAPNTNAQWNMARKLPWYATGVGICAYPIFHKEFTVPAQHVQKLRDHEGGYQLAGPGMHVIKSAFWSLEDGPVPLRGHIHHGDRTIVVVDQGLIGYASDNGHPVLLPPGIHQWQSQTLVFIRFIDLENHIIPLGPYTLVTVDEGYAAITQDNGKQVILPGGQTHFLDHRNWKFEKFMTLKIQTDDLQSIQATSADNIMMSVTSTVNWRVFDVEVASKMAASTMSDSGKTGDLKANITKLRNDVLKQAVASLAAFIGSVNYSASFHLAAAAQASSSAPALGVPAAAAEAAEFGDNPIFDSVRMSSAVHTANSITRTYGIEVMSINIISAIPVDQSLTRALASGAVASAEALQAETSARGNAKALLIEAQAGADAARIQAGGEAEAALIAAKADAEAEQVRAAGARDAADALSENDLATHLAKMDRQGAILGSKTKLIISQGEPGGPGGVLLRPDKFGLLDD